MNSLLGIGIAVVLMVIRDVSWVILCRRRILPEMVPKCTDPLREMFGGIVIAPVMEEILFRGPLLLATLCFGVTSIPTAISLVLGALIFGIVHISAVDDHFITSGWSKQEKRRVEAVAVLATIWGGLIYGFLVLYYYSLLPAIVIHSARNGFITISQLRGQKKREVAQNVCVERPS